MKKISTYIVLFGLLWSSCENDIEPSAVDDSLLFFPLEMGQYRIYEVDQIIYEISGFDTLSYMLKESVIDSFQTNGILTYLLEREVMFTGDEWISDSIWSVRQQENQLILNRSNNHEVILTIPVEVGREWDRNSFNNKGPNVVSYTESEEIILETLDLTGTEKIMVQIESIPRNIVNQKEHFEIYGKEIGLIQKQIIDLEFCTVDCDSANQIVTGQFFNQVISEIGTE